MQGDKCMQVQMDKYMHASLSKKERKKKKARAGVSKLFPVKGHIVNSLACEVHTLVTVTT